MFALLALMVLLNYEVAHSKLVKFVNYESAVKHLPIVHHR